MTTELRRAFEAASHLSDAEQDELALAILEELAADRRWDIAFGESQAALKLLANEALEEHRSGRTEILDPDEL